MSVAKYSHDDWEKLRAAVSALKNPVLDDSVLLESTKFGYIHSSNHDLTEDEVQALRSEHSSSFGYQPQDHNMGEYSNGRHRGRRASEGGILTHNVTEPLEANGASHYGANSTNPTSDWVAGLPAYGRRTRSHTDPVVPLDSLLAQRPRSSSQTKARTRPSGLPLRQDQSQDTPGKASRAGSEQRGGLVEEKEEEAPRTSTPPKSLSPAQASTSQRTSSMTSPSVSSDTRPSSGMLSPVASMTPNSKLIKVYMTRVQKGTFRGSREVSCVWGSCMNSPMVLEIIRALMSGSRGHILNMFTSTFPTCRKSVQVLCGTPHHNCQGHSSAGPGQGQHGRPRPQQLLHHRNCGNTKWSVIFIALNGTNDTTYFCHFVGSSRSLPPTENIVDILNKQVRPPDYRFELRRIRRPAAATGSQAAAAGARAPTGAHKAATLAAEKPGTSANEAEISRPQETKKCMLTHVQSLENVNSELQRKVDSLQLQLLNHQALKEKLSALQDSYTSLSDKHEQERLAHKTLTQQLQRELDEASLARRKAEEQLQLTGEGAEPGRLKESKSVLEEIQAKYTDQVSSLTSEIRVKDKTLQDMRSKRIALVSTRDALAYSLQITYTFFLQEEEVAELHEKLKVQERDVKLLNERNKQVHSLEKDLAVKEDTIHKLLAEKEQSQILASQVREQLRE